jgi:hypothetical protein
VEHEKNTQITNNNNNNNKQPHWALSIYCTSKSVNVNVHNIFIGNNITCVINFSYRIAATLRTLEAWLEIVSTVCKGNNNNNNNNNKGNNQNNNSQDIWRLSLTLTSGHYYNTWAIQ